MFGGRTNLPALYSGSQPTQKDSYAPSTTALTILPETPGKPQFSADSLRAKKSGAMNCICVIAGLVVKDAGPTFFGQNRQNYHAMILD
jgi:hypothetical protein